MNPTVSVILCGYNQGAYVKEAVDSVLGQTYPHFELIVVDNGSTDRSQAVLKEYEDDRRIRLLLHDTNAPVTRRLNEAMALASGEYVSILYADDYYLPHKLERQVREFSQLPADVGVVYSPAYRLDAVSGHRWIHECMTRSGFLLRYMLLRSHREGFINPISPLIRRECFTRYPYHEDVFAEGEAIFLRFALTYRFHYIDEPLAVMREHASNLGKAIKINADIALILFDKLSQERDFPPHLAADLVTHRAIFLASCGWLGIRMAADPRWARSCLLSAIRWRPSHVLRPRTLAGLALSALPASGIRVFNRAMNAMRAHNETIAFRPDYS
jgi:glycosyltransferase involved in cell wall biosynthesis